MNYIIPPTNYPVPSKKVAPDLPDYPLPEGFGNENAYLEYLVRQGAEQLYGTPVPDHVIDRVNFELEIIKDKSFTNYFLIVADMVCAAQERFNPNRSLEKVSCHFLMTAIRKTALYMLDL